MIFFDVSKFCLPIIIWTFFRFQKIFLDTKNVICPMPSAPQVFPISIRTVQESPPAPSLSAIFSFHLNKFCRCQWCSRVDAAKSRWDGAEKSRWDDAAKSRWDDAAASMSREQQQKKRFHDKIKDKISGACLRENNQAVLIFHSLKKEASPLTTKWAIYVTRHTDNFATLLVMVSP